MQALHIRVLLEDKNELAIDFFRSSFEPAKDLVGNIDIKTTQDIGDLFLSNGFNLSHVDIIHILNQEGFTKKYMGTGFFWILQRI